MIYKFIDYQSIIPSFFFQTKRKNFTKVLKKYKNFLKNKIFFFVKINLYNLALIIKI